MNDKKEGFGTYTWSDGNVFKGIYTNGKRGSIGTLQFANGCVFEGIFDNQKMSSGTISLDNKNYKAIFTEGDQIDNKYRVYQVTLEDDSGHVLKGTFSNGSFFPDTDSAMLMIWLKEQEEKRIAEERARQQELELEAQRAEKEASEKLAEEERKRILLEEEEQKVLEIQAELQREIDARKAEENRIRFQQQDIERRAVEETRRLEREANLKRAIEAASSPTTRNNIYTDNSNLSLQDVGVTKADTESLNVVKAVDKRRIQYDFGFYEGQVGEDETRHGQGVLTSTSGEFAGCVYDGMWDHNKREGLGLYKWRNGSMYSGQWSNDVFHGFGKLVWMAGEVYEGYFVNGNREGQGKLIWKSGIIFDGLFEKDLLKHGNLSTADGLFDAMFEASDSIVGGNRVYTVSMTNATGFEQTGSFINGVFSPDSETRKRLSLSIHS